MCVCVCVFSWDAVNALPGEWSGEAKQPGITGVFSEMEIYNMVTSLETRPRIIDLNEERRCSAPVDKRIVCSL